MAKKRWGCLREGCTDGLEGWKDSTEGGREYNMESGRERGACEGALMLGTGLATDCWGDVTPELLLEDAIDREREIGPSTRTPLDGMDVGGGTRGTSGVGGTLSYKGITDR